MIMNSSNRISSQCQREESREEGHKTPSTRSIKLFSVTITVGLNSSSAPEISSSFKKRNAYNRHDEIVFHDFLGVNRTEKEPIQSGSDNFMEDDDGFQEPESVLSEDPYMIKKPKVHGRSGEEQISPGRDGLMVGRGGFEEPNPMAHQDLWRINKRLTKSDVSNHLCRLMLSTKQVQQRIIAQWDADLVQRFEAETSGVSLAVWDYDTGSDYKLKFKRWRSSNSFVFSDWKENFVNRRGLKEGDEIGLFWDRTNSRFGFRVLNRK